MRTDRGAVVALILALGAASCDAPTMTAEEPEYDPTSPFGIYHWDAGYEIGIYVDRTNEPQGADLRAAVRDGIAAWKPVGRLGEIQMRIVDDLRRADVIVHHSTAPLLITPPEICPPPIDLGGGRTYLCVDENNDAVTLALSDGTQGRVKIDVAINRAVVDADSVFRALVVHELGHVLGIARHSPVQTDLMFGAPRRLTPTDADARTLRYVLARKPDVRF